MVCLINSIVAVCVLMSMPMLIDGTGTTTKCNSTYIHLSSSSSSSWWWRRCRRDRREEKDLTLIYTMWERFTFHKQLCNSSFVYMCVCLPVHWNQIESLSLLAHNPMEVVVVVVEKESSHRASSKDLLQMKKKKKEKSKLLLRLSVFLENIWWKSTQFFSDF